MRPKHKPGMICILLRNLNEANPRAEDAEFVARMSAYDTAFKMQIEAPEVFDLSKEHQETLDLYGVGNPLTDDYESIRIRGVKRLFHLVALVLATGNRDTTAERCAPTLR
jgi:hypothetical protein